MADRKYPEREFVQVPILIPSDRAENGKTVQVAEGELEILEGHLQNEKLVLKFGSTLAAAAMQRMIARGVAFGLTFVLLEEALSEPQPEEAAGDVAPEAPAE